jgi:hypothetical protein
MGHASRRQLAQFLMKFASSLGVTFALNGESE